MINGPAGDSNLRKPNQTRPATHQAPPRQRFGCPRVGITDRRMPNHRPARCPQAEQRSVVCMQPYGLTERR